jgi:hypothetical protein
MAFYKGLIKEENSGSINAMNENIKARNDYAEFFVML